MKEIPVSGGLVALVDDEDYEVVVGYAWCGITHPRRRTSYAMANIPGTRPQRNIYLHRLIMGAPSGIHVDHKNGNGLDCQRHNMRVATQTQNNHNTPKRLTYGGIPTRSRFKGVTWEPRREHWVANGNLNGKCIYLGSSHNEQEAALAYNAFALEHYGEFARLNTIGT
jgi:hypothetical protein